MGDKKEKEKEHDLVAMLLAGAAQDTTGELMDSSKAASFLEGQQNGDVKKTAKKTEKAFKKFFRQSTPEELEKLKSKIRPLRKEYTGRISQYGEMEDIYETAETTLGKLESKEAQMQEDWNVFESGEVQGYSFGKSNFPYLNVGTWGKYFDTLTNYYPEDHVLHKEGALYKNLFENRENQRMIEDALYGERPYPVFGSAGTGYGLKKSMSAFKSKSENVLHSLAEMETEYRKINKGQYLEGIEELDPRVKNEADELLKDFIKTIR
jgi:hypothetical protein